MKSEIISGSECDSFLKKINLKLPFFLETILRGDDYSLDRIDIEFIQFEKAAYGFIDHKFMRVIYKPIKKAKKISMWLDQDFIIYNKLPDY